MCSTSLAAVGIGTPRVDAAVVQWLARARYQLLPAENRLPMPCSEIEFTYESKPGGNAADCTWQLALLARDGETRSVLCHVRVTSNRDPLAATADAMIVARYQLAVPEAAEILDYRDIHTDRALLPPWSGFAGIFLPKPAAGTTYDGRFPHTCEFLGHVLSLEPANTPDAPAFVEPPDWSKAKILRLDPELLVGTGRTKRDREGHRLPPASQPKDYHYAELISADYTAAITAGENLFLATREQESHVRGQAVFYIHPGDEKRCPEYPVDFYRSNYLGIQMYLDEPTCVMIGDKRVHDRLRYFTDVAALLTMRVHAAYDGPRGATHKLERELISRGSASLGNLRLANYDIPSWETAYETAYYQLAGGLAGIVHEGRYRLDDFNAHARSATGFERTYTADQMLRYIYAHLRGAARHFGKNWGMSIYGQSDPALSPHAITLAYDMGARYVWFWTSDRDHHMPWPEQLTLADVLRQHAAVHRRPSIRGEQPTLDKVILIPYSYFLVLESATGRKEASDLWWVRELDPQGQNEASQRYRRLIRNTFVEVQKAFDANEDFDICVDDGRPIEGYRQIVRVHP